MSRTQCYEWYRRCKEDTVSEISWHMCIHLSYGQLLLASRQTYLLEDHPLLAVRDCLSSVFVSDFHI